MSPSEQRVLAWMRQGNTACVNEIAKALKMKKPTVYKAVKNLTAAEKVCIVEMVPVNTPQAQVSHIFGAVVLDPNAELFDVRATVRRREVGTWERKNASAGMIAPASWCGVLA